MNVLTEPDISTPAQADRVVFLYSLVPGGLSISHSEFQHSRSTHMHIGFCRGQTSSLGYNMDIRVARLGAHRRPGCFFSVTDLAQGNHMITGMLSSKETLEKC